MVLDRYRERMSLVLFMLVRVLQVPYRTLLLSQSDVLLDVVLPLLQRDDSCCRRHHHYSPRASCSFDRDTGVICCLEERRDRVLSCAASPSWEGTRWGWLICLAYRS